MKKITEQRTIVQEVNVYVANDGTEFDTRYECDMYEEELKREEFIEAAEKLRIEDLDEYMPLTCQDTVGNNTYRWYKLENESDFEILEKAYYQAFLGKPPKYPEIICVETCTYEPYEDDAYSYLLSDCKTETEEFWKLFGYEVEFKKVEE